uniref:Ig-like domain-containing protein n=1 Tax=Leptobrachium leishanense TaxID=445787 RepID=A0A8C5P7F8_9ANUR
GSLCTDHQPPAQDATKKNKLTLCFFCHCVLVYAQDEHWGEFAKSAILTCRFEPESNLVIHWTIKLNETKYVHSYYRGCDQLAVQDSQFKDRTSLFSSELCKGNASLKIQNLTTEDEYTYTCYVSTVNKYHESHVTLKISRFQQQTIDYEGKNGTFTLNCSVKYCYPESAINITWYHEKKSEISDVETKCLQRIATSRNPFGPYQCLIHHSKLNQTWHGTWEWLAASCKKPYPGISECSLCDTIDTNSSMEVKLCLNDSKNYNLHIKTSGESYFECMSTDNITGEFSCVSETMHNKHIIVLSININENGNSQNKLLWLLLLIPLVAVIVLCWWKRYG